jgi:MULE transposase domain/SWIM zinc finger
MEFETKKDVKLFLQSNSVSIHRPFRIKKSDKSRVSAVCSILTCEYKMNFTKNSDGKFKLFKQAEHTCIHRVGTARSDWAMNSLAEGCASVIDLCPNDAKNVIFAESGYEISYWMSWKCLQRMNAKKKREIFNSFQKIIPFLKWQEENNPKTVVDYEVFDDKFKYCFICPSLSSSGFPACLPLIALDACHSQKGDHVMLFASSLSGADKIVPLAFAIAPSENEMYWKRFILKLRQALELHERCDVVILSDREKGIFNAVQEILPVCKHSFCAYHIEKNMKVKFKSDGNKAIWKISKASTVEAFEMEMNRLRELNPATELYLRGIPPENWSRAHFPVPRFGHVTSNIAESMNAWMKTLRKQAPFFALVSFVEFVSKHFAERKEKYSAELHVLPRRIQQAVDGNVEEGRFLKVQKTTSASKFQVQTAKFGSFFRVVDVESKSCSCKGPWEFGIPCSHLCAVSLHLNLQAETFCHVKRQISEIRKIYSEEMELCDVTCLESVEIKPNDQAKIRGRPKTRRIRSSGEKIKNTVVCSNCGNRGHNKRACKAILE